MKPLLLFFLALTSAARAAVTDEPVDDQRLQAELLKFGETQLEHAKATKGSILALIEPKAANPAPKAAKTEK